MTDEQEKLANQQKMDEYINNLLINGDDKKAVPKMTPIYEEEVEDITEEEKEEYEDTEEDEYLTVDITVEELENDEEEFDIDEIIEKENIEENDNNDGEVNRENNSNNVNENTDEYETQNSDEINDNGYETNERDFYVTEESDFYDPQEESLLYSDNSDDNVLFDELNSSDNDEEENKESGYNPEEKIPFKELNVRKPFMAGKFNKTAGLVCIGVFVICVIGALSYLAKKNEKIAEEKANVEEDLNLNGYKPDFGNYKERGYKEDVKDGMSDQALKNKEAVEEIDKKFGITEEKPKYVSQTTVQNPNPGNSSGTSNYQERVESSLRYKGEGFGSKNGEVYYSDDSSNKIKNRNVPVTYGYEDYANNYMGNIENIKNNINGKSNLNINNGRYSDAGKYEPDKTGGDINYIPEYSIYPGTVIHAVLINGINTDYPGTITGRVINNVYDSKTGKTLLIPSGSIVRGSYSSSSIGINRIQIAWQNLIINRDGMDYVVNLGSMVGIDRSGYSGIKGTLNEHAFEYLKAAGLSCLFTYINSNIFEVTQAQKNKTVQEMIAGSQEIGNKLADKILDRALDIQPTVVVKPGTNVSIDVDKILTLMPYKEDIPKERYIRQ